MGFREGVRTLLLPQSKTPPSGTKMRPMMKNVGRTVAGLKIGCQACAHPDFSTLPHTSPRERTHPQSLLSQSSVGRPPVPRDFLLLLAFFQNLLVGLGLAAPQDHLRLSDSGGWAGEEGVGTGSSRGRRLCGRCGMRSAYSHSLIMPSHASPSAFDEEEFDDEMRSRRGAGVAHRRPPGAPEVAEGCLSELSESSQHFSKLAERERVCGRTRTDAEGEDDAVDAQLGGSRAV